MDRITPSPDRRTSSVVHDLQLLDQLLCRLPSEGGSAAFFDVLRAVVMDARAAATDEVLAALQQWEDSPIHPEDRVPRLLALLRSWGYLSGDTGLRFRDLLADAAWRYQQLFWQEAGADPASAEGHDR